MVILNQDKLFYDAYNLALRLNKGNGYRIPWPEIEKNLPCFVEAERADSRHVRLGPVRIQADDGGILYSFTDLHIKSLAGELALERRYHSGTAKSVGKTSAESRGCGLLGIGWTLEYETYCRIESTRLEWIHIDGTKDCFSKKGYEWSNQAQGSRITITRDDPTRKEIYIGNGKRRHIFGYDGRLRRIIDNNENYIELRYINEINQIQKIISSCGKQLDFSYQADKVAEVRDHMGRCVCFFYDGDFLIQAEQANGGSYFYEYKNLYRKISAITNPEGQKEIELSYDRNGKPASASLMGGVNCPIIFDERKKCMSVETQASVFLFARDKKGNITEVSRNGKEDERYAYDDEDRLITTEGKNGHREYTYNEAGEIASEENSRGRVEYEYNGSGWMTRESRSNGFEKLMDYDSRGNLISLRKNYGKGMAALHTYKYDGKGRMIQGTDANKNSRNYIYKSADSIYAETILLPNGHSIERQYDDLSRCIKVTQDATSTRYKYNNMGLLVQQIYQDGSRDFRRYNRIGYLQEIVLPVEVKASYEEKRAARKFRYVYDVYNRLIQVIMPSGKTLPPKPPEAADAEGWTVTETDFRGKVLKAYEQWGAEPGKYRMLQMEYDKMGQMTKKSLATEAVLLGEEAPYFLTYRYEYDDRGNLCSVRSSRGEERRMYYQGEDRLKSEVIRINENTVYQMEYRYDGMGRLSQKIELLAEEDANLKALKLKKGDVSAVKIITYFFYNESGGVERIVLPDGEGKIFSYDIDGEILNPLSEPEEEQAEVAECFYDTQGRLIKRSFPDETFEVLAYDYAGNIIERKNRQGETELYGYNSINRLRWEQVIKRKRHHLYGKDGKISRVMRLIYRRRKTSHVINNAIKT